MYVVISVSECTHTLRRQTQYMSHILNKFYSFKVFNLPTDAQ